MIQSWFESKCFGAIHSRNLVYNTCWEDPRLDRQALGLGPSDRIVMITSAGCNALDYDATPPWPCWVCHVRNGYKSIGLIKVALNALCVIAWWPF